MIDFLDELGNFKQGRTTQPFSSQEKIDKYPYSTVHNHNLEELLNIIINKSYFFFLVVKFHEKIIMKDVKPTTTYIKRICKNAFFLLTYHYMSVRYTFFVKSQHS